MPVELLSTPVRVVDEEVRVKGATGEWSMYTAALNTSTMSTKSSVVPTTGAHSCVKESQYLSSLSVPEEGTCRMWFAAACGPVFMSNWSTLASPGGPKFRASV